MKTLFFVVLVLPAVFAMSLAGVVRNGDEHVEETRLPVVTRHKRSVFGEFWHALQSPGLYLIKKGLNQIIGKKRSEGVSDEEIQRMLEEVRDQADRDRHEIDEYAADAIRQVQEQFRNEAAQRQRQKEDDIKRNLAYLASKYNQHN